MKLTILSIGRFWLDGGAMFGIVPKVLWNKLNPADEFNRIELAMNCLLIQTDNKILLVDTGIGENLGDRFIELYKIEQQKSLTAHLSEHGIRQEDVDFVINTHLHFDHCGGNTRARNGNYVPAFPKAQYVVQKQEWYDAIHPNERTKASYLKNTFLPVEEAGQVMLVQGEHEICQGIKVISTTGHTKGHQSVLIESEGKKAIYLGDLIPTASHIKIPYIMGYDLYPIDLIDTKKDILARATSEHWLLIFEHDRKTPLAYLVDEGGKRLLKSLKDV